MDSGKLVGSGKSSGRTYHWSALVSAASACVAFGMLLAAFAPTAAEANALRAPGAQRVGTQDL